MVCPVNWGGQDEFIHYGDCHVWLPAYRIFYSLLLIFGFHNALLAGYKLRHPGFRSVPLFIALHSLFLVIYAAIRLGTGLTLGERNLGLNIPFGLCCGFVWCYLSAFSFRYLAAVMLTEKLSGHKDAILYKAKCGFRIFTFLIFLTFVLFVSFTCVTNLQWIPGYWILSITSLVSVATVTLTYGLKVRILLNSMQMSKALYAQLRCRLDLYLVPFTCLSFSAIFCMILFDTVPVFIRNQYILNFMLQFGSQIMCSIMLCSNLTGPKDINDDPTKSSDNLAQTTMGNPGETVQSQDTFAYPQNPVTEMASYHPKQSDASTAPSNSSITPTKPSRTATLDHSLSMSTSNIQQDSSKNSQISITSASVHPQQGAYPMIPQLLQMDTKNNLIQSNSEVNLTLLASTKGSARLEEIDWGDPEVELSGRLGTSLENIFLQAKGVHSPRSVDLSLPIHERDYKEDWNVQ